MENMYPNGNNNPMSGQHYEGQYAQQSNVYGGPVYTAPVPVQYQGSSGTEAKPINCDDVMRVTSFTDLQQYAAGTIVRFPDFAEGQPFIARVRRPSMLILAKQNKIPNSLLAAAGSLFAKGGAGMNTGDVNMLKDVYDICKIICEASLVQPTLKEIEEAGVELSDDQLMAIFNYTQTGVKALESFRKE